MLSRFEENREKLERIKKEKEEKPDSNEYIKSDIIEADLKSSLLIIKKDSAEIIELKGDDNEK